MRDGQKPLPLPPNTRQLTFFAGLLLKPGIQFDSSLRNVKRAARCYIIVSAIVMPLIINNGGFWSRHRWLMGTLLVVAAVVLFASFMSRGESVPVRAATAVRTDIRSVVSTNGKVEPLQNFEAHTPVGTTIKAVLVKEGQQVKKGQLLVQMDDAEARSEAARALAQVRAAEAEGSAITSGGNREEVLTIEAQLTKARSARDSAQRNYDALQRLQQDGAASAGEVKSAADQLQRANADVTLLEQKKKERYSGPEIARAHASKAEAEAAYAAAEDRLNQLNVRAPFDGIVYSLPLTQGAYVNPGDMVLQEANLSKVRVRAFVDEPDVARLALGDPIEVTWDAMPGRVWSSTITAIPAVIKPHNTRNVGETTFVVDNSDFRLLPNVNVNVSVIAAQHQNVLTVPREAVHEEDNRTFVYEIQGDTLQRRDVQIAISNLTQVEITSGLQENAQVALVPMNGKPLKNGLAVRVVH
jgi:HlyD family secretion protein